MLVEPRPVDAFRAGVRAALLSCPDAAGCRFTAARVHRLWGLPIWTPAEVPALLVPAGRTKVQRPGMRIHFGLQPGEKVVRRRLPVTSLARTVSDLADVLALDELVCLLDSALRAGWTIDDIPRSRRRRAILVAALSLADIRSESVLETLLRLLLVRARLAPEVLQLSLTDRDGRIYARLDFAWPSCRLAVEADGKEHHDSAEALHRDRVRQNHLMVNGWTVLRFTWADVVHDPEWVVSQVRQALAAGGRPQISTSAR